MTLHVHTVTICNNQNAVKLKKNDSNPYFVVDTFQLLKMIYP